MNQNIVKNRYLISEQMKGMFTKIKVKIAIEEWFQYIKPSRILIASQKDIF